MPEHSAAKIPAWTRWGHYGDDSKKSVSRRKRLLDLSLVVSAVPLWLPLVLATAILVRIKLGRPVIFFQARPGWGGRVFPLFKFRTMTDARDEAGNLKPDHERLTPAGRWLRAASMDELPGLFNVLRGDLSLVGPRPLLPSYLPLYTQTQARRHEVLPGVTGWAQVNGRNAISWEEKFRMDVWYVEHASVGLDIHILFQTVEKVFRRKNISADGEATMPPFTGSIESSP